MLSSVFCGLFVLLISVRFAPQQDPLPYMVSQPLPWQVHSVSHSRKSSKADEVSINKVSYHTNKHAAVPPLSPVEAEKAAATIQTHFRKFQQKKHKNGK
uniref:Uncharacterized protein n=1 Tax=Sphaeramia orbicularis TaxID=375764 RepID=A0A673B160_9TELE